MALRKRRLRKFSLVLLLGLSGLILAGPRAAESKTVSVTKIKNHLAATFDTDNNGAIDGMSISNRDGRQVYFDIDQDGEWDSWEIHRGRSRIQFEDKIGSTFLKITFTKIENGKINSVVMRYSPVTRSYVLARAASRKPVVHHMDSPVFIDEVVAGETLQPACGPKNPLSSVPGAAFDIKAKTVRLQAEAIGKSKLVDESCLKHDTYVHRFNYIVAKLAKDMTGNDEDTNKYLTCMAQYGWNAEAVRVRGYLAQLSADPTKSKFKCESMRGDLPAGEYREATGDVILRGLQTDSKTAQLIQHEAYMHDAAGLADKDIAEIETCCGDESRYDEAKCKASRERSARRYHASLRGLMKGFSDYPEIQDLIIERYIEEGIAGITAVRRVYTLAAGSTLNAIQDQCNPRDGKPPTSCKNVLEEKSKNFAEKFIAGLCSGDYAERCKRRQNSFNDFKTRSTENCSADPSKCFTSDKIEWGAVYHSLAGVGGKSLFSPPVIQTRQGSRPVRVAAPAVGPRVDLDDPAEARKAIARADRHAFETSENAGRVYDYVREKTRGFTRGLASLPSNISGGPAAEKKAASEPTVPDIDIDIHSLRPLDPAPGQASVAIDLPRNRIPTYIMSATGGGGAGDMPSGRKREAVAEPTTLMGVPVVDPTAILDQVVSRGSGAVSGAVSGGVLPLPSFRNRNPDPKPASPRRASASVGMPQVGMPQTDYMERLQAPYTKILPLLGDPGERSKFMRYLDTNRIQVRPPSGDPYGHSRPKTRITYPDMTGEPEISKVGR